MPAISPLTVTRSIRSNDHRDKLQILLSQEKTYANHYMTADLLDRPSGNAATY